MSSNYPNRSSFHFSLQIESRQCEISWPPFFIVAVWNSLDSCTFSPGSLPRKNFEKISKTDENLAVLAFRAVKRRVKKWTFVATGEGVILDVRASAAWKNMNARERTTKIAQKLCDWQHFPFLDEKVNVWKSELLLRLERELSEMSEPVQLGKTWMHAKERRKLLENWAIGSLFRFWAKWNWNVKLCETLKRPKMRIFRKFKTLWRSVNFFQTARETTASLRRRIKELTFLCKATELTWVLP